MSAAAPTAAISVASPLPGRLIPLSEVPDPVFAKGLVGGGAAVVPDDDAGVLTAVAPLDGRVIKVMPHAYIVQHASGPAVLVHVGIDTVNLKGEGFGVRAQKGDQVRAGDPMVTVNVTLVRSKNLSMCSPVVILDTAADAVDAPDSGARVEAGGHLFNLPGQ
jgi:PTS system N-acetylglucosamine-specific IIA component